MVKLSATLEITPIKFDTDSWKNFSTGYKITCVNYTHEELKEFHKIAKYSQFHKINSSVVFTLEEVLDIVKQFHSNTPNLHTIRSTANHPVFSDDFRSEIVE
jgi:hypothetical protein